MSRFKLFNFRYVWLALVTLFFVLLFVVVSQMSLPSFSSKPSRQGVWVWQQTSAAELVGFAKIHGVTDLYVNTVPGFSSDVAYLTYLKGVSRAAHVANLKMWALAGDPLWTVEPQNVQNWVSEVGKSGLFDGIHLDVETHQLASWDTNQQSLIGSALNTYRVAGTTADVYGLNFAASLPWWWYTIGYADGNFAQKIVPMLDTVAIITYNTDPYRIFADGTPIANYAQQNNKPFRFASETNQMPAGEEEQSFFGHTDTQMEKVIAEVSSRASKTWKKFEGWDVHDYAGWKKLYP